MAKTANSIYLDYRKTMKQADRLDEVAAKIRKERARLSDCHKSIHTAWKGENATAYLNKVKKVSEDLNRMVKNLNNTADTIRKIAKATYQAERKAIEIAKERKY